MSHRISIISNFPQVYFSFGRGDVPVQRSLVQSPVQTGPVVVRTSDRELHCVQYIRL